jgi:hypothetical protein
MGNKTALQQLIEWIDTIDNSVFALSASKVELAMLKQFKTKCQSPLSTERQQIIDAFDEGKKEMMRCTKHNPCKYVTPEQYYSTTYKQ